MMDIRHAIAYLTSSSGAVVANQFGEHFRLEVKNDVAWFEVCWHPHEYPYNWEPMDIRGHTFEVAS